MNVLLDAYLAVRPPREPGDAIVDSPERQALVAYLVTLPLAETAARAVYRKVQPFLHRDAATLELADVIQQARVSLIDMADDFDPSRDKRFLQCAHHRLRQRLVTMTRRAFRGGPGPSGPDAGRASNVSLDEEMEGFDRPVTRMETIAGREDTPHLALQKADVAKAIAALPEKQRVAVVMHVLEGHTFEDIAECLGCAVSTAYGHCEKGKAALAESLAAYRDGFDCR